ncbi:MAG: SDR family NAD(P)-dependent oxidoreductase, partial [Thermodesulfobacteriota bacterium]
MNMFDLTGKKAIVTGGAGGLGRGMVEGLHEAGAEVAIIDITDQIDAIANEIGRSGAKV